MKHSQSKENNKSASKAKQDPCSGVNRAKGKPANKYGEKKQPLTVTLTPTTIEQLEKIMIEHG